MPNYGGYMGWVVKIDLTHETVSEYSWSDRERELYLGGKPMAARILLDHLTGKETAFSEDNWVILTTGPLTGTGTPGSVRFDIAALSPKDHCPTLSNCGGSFGLYLKKAGYDALILTGRCQDRRWLEINEKRITFHDAAFLWGTGTGKCQELLTEELGQTNFGRLCIGPAGENLVKFASVIGDGHTAGRAGLGAVLGWKNLKAITVTGGKTVPLYAPEKAAAWNKKWYGDLKRHPHTGGDGVSKPSCSGCPIHCTRHSDKENYTILNELGLDVFVAADVAAWAAEQGIVSPELYEDMAYRRGIGNELAEGGKRPSARGQKGKKRRNESCRAILQSFGLASDSTAGMTFYRDLTEAVSAGGQCIFTVNALCPAFLIQRPNAASARLTRCMLSFAERAFGLMRQYPGRLILRLSNVYQIKMLRYVTGMRMNPGSFLQIGQRSRALEQQLKDRFADKT